jgi:hypothetical protein
VASGKLTEELKAMVPEIVKLELIRYELVRLPGLSTVTINSVLELGVIEPGEQVVAAPAEPALT